LEELIAEEEHEMRNSFPLNNGELYVYVSLSDMEEER